MHLSESSVFPSFFTLAGCGGQWLLISLRMLEERRQAISRLYESCVLLNINPLSRLLQFRLQ